MKVYQPVANGSYALLNGIGTIHSKYIFTSRKSAEARIPEFLKLCAGTGHNDLVEGTIRINIEEFELITE